MGFDGVEVSVMAWSSTTVDVSHMHLYLVCEGQSRVLQSMCVVGRLSKCVGVGCVLSHNVTVVKSVDGQ